MPADLDRRGIHQNLIIPFPQLLSVRVYLLKKKIKTELSGPTKPNPTLLLPLVA